jgi:hypothetical protein
MESILLDLKREHSAIAALRLAGIEFSCNRF